MVTLLALAVTVQPEFTEQAARAEFAPTVPTGFQPTQNVSACAKDGMARQVVRPMKVNTILNRVDILPLRLITKETQKAFKTKKCLEPAEVRDSPLRPIAHYEFSLHRLALLRNQLHTHANRHPVISQAVSLPIRARPIHSHEHQLVRRRRRRHADLERNGR